jgi:hypothetical protein
MTSMLRSLIFLLCLTTLPSCGNSALFIPKTVYVAPGVPMRLREDVKKVKVWVLVKDAEGKQHWTPSIATLRNGMFVLAKSPPKSTD